MGRKNNNNEWFDRSTGANDVKVLGATELSLLRSLIKDLINTCDCDDSGVTIDLHDKALACAEILGVVYVNPIDEDDGPPEDYKPPKPAWEDEDD